jgi:hypothetical protein
VILYHFTRRYRAEGILQIGFMIPQPWAIGDWDLSDFPDVTWFQASRHRRAFKGHRPGDGDWSIPANTEIRFTVDITDAQPWRRWATHHGLNVVKCRLAANGFAPRWYVCERPVQASEWISVAYASNGREFRLPAYAEGSS